VNSVCLSVMASPSPNSEEPSPTSPENRPQRGDQDEAGPPDEEEDEEDEEEPQLKYERIGGDIAKVVRSDLVSTVCVGSKVIVLSSIFTWLTAF
jgi:vacuolar protein sorting-associated protein 41